MASCHGRVVLAQKVGQKRSFGVGLLLTIVTFGIYAVYWNYRAHSELYRQFELAREGRDEGMVWYVLGLTLPPFLIPYFWVFAANVAYVRERIGLTRRMTPGRFVLLAGLGVGAIAAGIILVQAAYLATGESADDPEASTPLVDNAVVILVLLALVAAVLVGLAYRGLQRDINELWDAYDARIRYLAQNPAEMAQHSAYMADLRPVDQQAMSTPLRAEVERLRARHPDLRALAEMDALLAKADAGDAEARERAEALLGDVAGVLQERAELLRRKDERAREAGRIRERIAAGTIFEEDLKRELAALGTEDLDERLIVLEQALFRRP